MNNNFLVFLIFLILGCTKVQTTHPNESKKHSQNEQESNIENEQKYYTCLNISKDDSSVSLVANMKYDFSFYGYEKPDTSSIKMILFSIFTDEVQGNPSKCFFGSYYQTSGLDSLRLKFKERNRSFVKVDILNKDIKESSVFFKVENTIFDE